MLDLTRHFQLDIMLMLGSVCVALAYLLAISKTLAPQRKRALLLLEISSAALLFADRLVYLHNGDTSAVGYWVMRICNFEVYFFALVITYSFTVYLSDVCIREGWYEAPPKRLRACAVLLVVGAVFLLISQFTGLYYTFDEFNHYERAPGFIICYIFPSLVYVLLLSVVFQNFGKMRPIVRVSLLFFVIGPICASVFQAFTPWISLNNMSVAFFGILLFSFDYIDLNNQAQRAHQREIEATQAREREARRMFEQTASALASAIDEKDAYTRGHSARVAAYARLIAERAGMDAGACDEVYYAGLLHDVGKIGIPGAIITKAGRLTDEESEIVKTHPVRGDRILSSIAGSPYLREGARYHHEHYDGAGYPDGLAGDEIPEVARVIAVADAYDAMTSKRSYRDTMPQEAVREQVEQGLGTQFDLAFGRILLQLIDEDAAYQMRETA